MPPIPEFQRRRLASSALGTAGVDTSGQQIGNSIAQATAGVADTMVKVAVKRQEALDKAVTFDTLMDYEAEMEKVTQENRQQYATFDGDPTVPAESLRTRGIELRDRFSASLSSDAARLDFLERSGSHLNTKFKGELEYSSKNQVALGVEKLTSANNKLINKAYGLFMDTGVDYRNKLTTLNGLEARRLEAVNASQALLGVEETAKLDKSSRTGLVKAAVAGLMETDPTQAMQFLKDKGVKAALGPDDHASWAEKAKKAASDFKANIKDREFEYVIQNNMEDLKAVQNGAGLDYIMNMKDEKASEILLDQYLDAKQLTEEEIATREADLLTRWQDFFVRDKDGKLTGQIKKDKSMKDVVELQYDYMRNFKIMRGKGQLKASLTNYPEMLRQAIKKDKPNPLLTAFLSGLDAVTFGASDLGKKQREKDTAIMADKLYSKLAKLDPNRTEDLQAAVQETLREYQFQKTPKMSRYVVGQEYTAGGQTFKAVRRPDGSIGLEQK